MSDNKTIKDERDRNKVNSGEPYEVEELHRKYSHLDHQTVAAAVKEQGPDRQKIEDYLNSLGNRK